VTRRKVPRASSKLKGGEPENAWHDALDCPTAGPCLERENISGRRGRRGLGAKRGLAARARADEAARSCR
jgi:hypothetical protein